MSKWIDFVLFDATRGPVNAKTSRWQVVTKDGKTTLGSVHWFSNWRQYAFFPLPHTVYERQCLRDIADFCEQQTKDHREHLAATRGSVPA